MTTAGPSLTGVVDSHVHLWDTTAREYPWLGDLPALDRPVLADELVTATGGTVPVLLVQAGCHWDQAREEVTWFASLAPGLPVAGVVAGVRLESPEAPEHLEWLAGQPLVRGVRRLVQDEPRGFALDDVLVANTRRLAGLGLVSDLCIRWHQLPEVTALVRSCEQVQFVLDHCGKPPIADGALDAWSSLLAGLAAEPNVVCKLSGLTSEAGAAQHDVPRFLRTALEVFGPERCLFGSDWPVCTGATSWQGWHDEVRRALEGLDEPGRAAVLGGNAVRVYGLDLTTTEGTPR